MAERNADVEETRRMRFRIGINQGDVVFDDSRVYGDGVNVAARLECLAEPRDICISRKVHEDSSGKMRMTFARETYSCALAANGQPTAVASKMINVGRFIRSPRPRGRAAPVEW